MMAKATPNQLLVSHPPSALKLMRAGGILGSKWSSKSQVLLEMVVKITSSTRPKILYCAGTNGITCGRKSRGDEKQQ